MNVPTFLPNLDVLVLDHLTLEDNRVVLRVHTVGPASCPLCHQPSERVHSYYRRTLLDLPWQGHAVHYKLACRRFFCDNRQCSRRIFTEPLPTVAARYARKTCRLAATLYEVCYLVSGEVATQITHLFGLSISPDALLHGLKSEASSRKAEEGAPVPASTASDSSSSLSPRVLGMDDFAFRRGHTYGTILVDLETHVPVDLLPDREAESVAAWLKAHPGVEIISRDRGNCYVEGASKGAPNAVQVTDRWHLLKNLGDALEKFLTRKHQMVREAVTGATAADNRDLQRTTIEDAQGDLVPNAEEDKKVDEPGDQALRRQRRVDQYEQVMRLHRSDMNVSGIARQTGLCRKTIRTYLDSDGFPERRERICSSGKLTPFMAYLQRRFGEGCFNAARLCEEIRARGFAGKYSIVKAFVATLRTKSAIPPTSADDKERKRRVMLSSRRLSWLLTNQDSPKVTEAERQAMHHLAESCPEVASAAALGTQFCTMVRQRKAEELPVWLEAAKQSGVAELKTFAAGLMADRAAIEAALTLHWSNGQTEGQVNRLKFIKRQMYGRASFDLLRARVVPRRQSADSVAQ